MSRIPRIVLGAVTFLGLVSPAGGLHAYAAGQQSRAPRSARAGSLPGFNIGAPRSMTEPSWFAYYDGHKDVYLNTDVSNKAQARSLDINFAPILGKSLGASSPMYFVKGRAAKGQVAVFGSEPGESDYSPLWREIWVTWKAGVKPALLVRDDQINSLAAKGKLTKQITKIVLNAPVTSVGH
jgi:hypothetical protein